MIQTLISRLLPALCVAVCLVRSLVAQVPTTQNNASPLLNLDDCLQLALQAPSAVQAAHQEVLASRYAVKTAIGAFFPLTAVQGSFVSNTSRNGVQDFVALNGPQEYQSFLSSTVELDTSGRLRAQLSRARADRDLARANL